MINQTGKVVAIDEHWVWLETIRQSTCQNCASKPGCGVSALTQVYSAKRHWLKVPIPSDVSLQLHDEVELAIHEHTMLKASALVYALPLVGLVCGALIGHHSLAHILGDAAAISGTVIGFGATLGLSKLAQHYWMQETVYPRIARVLFHADGSKPVAWVANQAQV